jgi:tetratricopeptide (TPR) repeat protein
MEPKLASAIALHKQGELDAAENIYESILEGNEDHPEALHFLGVLRHQQGRSLTGLDLVRRALALRPDYVDALNNLGNIQQQLDCPMDAIASYRCALELQPEHPDALRNLGIALRKVKRHEQGAEVLERAIEQAPTRSKTTIRSPARTGSSPASTTRSRRCARRLPSGPSRRASSAWAGC